MTTTPRAGFGQLLGCDPLGGTSYTPLGNIVEGWDGPNSEVQKVDTTLLGDKNMTSLPADADPGVISFKIAYDPDSSVTTLLTALRTSGAVATWQRTFANPTPTAPPEVCHGWLKTFKPSVMKRQMIMADVEIQVTGNPGFTGG